MSDTENMKRHSLKWKRENICIVWNENVLFKTSIHPRTLSIVIQVAPPSLKSNWVETGLLKGKYLISGLKSVESLNDPTLSPSVPAVLLSWCWPKLESKFARSSSQQSWLQQHLASVAPGCPSRWRTLKAAQPTCRCRQGDPTLDLLVLEPEVCQPESWQSDTGTVSLLHLPHLRGESFHVLLHIWYLVNTWEESVNGGEPEEASNSSLLLLLWETLLQPSSLMRLVPVWDHLQQGLHCCLGDETLPSGPGEVVGY